MTPAGRTLAVSMFGAHAAGEDIQIQAILGRAGDAEG
jgi:hypothetical protein